MRTPDFGGCAQRVHACFSAGVQGVVRTLAALCRVLGNLSSTVLRQSARLLAHIHAGVSPFAVNPYQPAPAPPGYGAAHLQKWTRAGERQVT
jgi:hypothetical protein